MGPPCRVTEDRTVAALLDALGKGASVEAACACAGLGRATFYDWMNRAYDIAQRVHAAREIGQPPEEVRDPEALALLRFAEAVEQVRAERQVRMLGIVDKVARGGYPTKVKSTLLPDGTEVTEREWASPDWRAAAWWVERAFPAQFGKQAATHRVEVSGPQGGPIAVESATVVAALSARLHEALAAARERGEVPALPPGGPVIDQDGQAVSA